MRGVAGPLVPFPTHEPAREQSTTKRSDGHPGCTTHPGNGGYGCISLVLPCRTQPAWPGDIATVRACPVRGGCHHIGTTASYLCRTRPFNPGFSRRRSGYHGECSGGREGRRGGDFADGVVIANLNSPSQTVISEPRRNTKRRRSP